jgi:hypothetical protein
MGTYDLQTPEGQAKASFEAEVGYPEILNWRNQVRLSAHFMQMKKGLPHSLR